MHGGFGKLSARTVGLFLALGLLMFSAALGLTLFLPTGPRNVATELSARDPDSPTVVFARGHRSLLEPVEWTCEIALNGKRVTQHAGWPAEQVAPSDAPKSLTWHNNPDWVEIALSSGKKLKLTWDPAAEKHARASGASMYFLDPRFEIVNDEPAR